MPKIGENIILSWVPVAENPFENTLKQNRGGKLNFIEGLFVARIAVKPIYGHITYFWKKDEDCFFSIRTDSLF